MTTIRSAILKYFAEEMRDQDTAGSIRYDSPYMGQQLRRRMAVKGRGGFVQDHQMQGSFGNREGAGHFDHLPFPDREVADDCIEGDAVTRKNFIEFAIDQSAGSLSPTPSGDVLDAGRGHSQPP